MILLILVLLALLIGPFFWVRYVLKKYSKERSDLPGTGGELATHLIKRFELEGVELAEVPKGDRYELDTRKVCLTPDVMNGKSLTAVATAAHEVGHAMQHCMNDRRLKARMELGKTAFVIERIAQVALIILPFAGLIPFLHPLAVIMMGVVILSMFTTTLVHLVTLPVEIDASFNKAYPLLVEGEYVQSKDLRKIKTILRACALTYVSSAAFSLLNVYRWLNIIRR